MFFSFFYLSVRALLGLLVRSGRGPDVKDIELMVLRHELEVLRRQVGRPRLEPADRALLAAAACHLPRSSRRALLVTPGTLLRWHRALVRRKWREQPGRLGRPRLSPEIPSLLDGRARRADVARPATRRLWRTRGVGSRQGTAEPPRRRERRRKQHPPMLPEPGIGGNETRNLGFWAKELDPACRVLDPCIDSRACRPQPSEPRSGRTARLPFSTSTARSPSTVRLSGSSSSSRRGG
jgi:hypothetical protein